MAHLDDLRKYPKTFAHKLPEYFTISEMEYSETAIRNNIDNRLLNAEHYENARQLLLKILDPLRRAWTKYCIDNNLGRGGIIVTSGYRCEELNTLVDGSKTSAHCIGAAADIKPSNKQMNDFQEFVPKWLKDNNIEFDQCILEQPKNGIATWLHIGHKNRNGKQRKQIFTLI